MPGTWDRRPFGAPAMLSRMRLGAVGLGRLGGKVARMATAADMVVRYYDPSVSSNLYGRAANLIELATWSDVLTIHVPHEPETDGLINHEVMSAMPAGGYVVNTSRGELIDWAALQELLVSGHLAGAALDVFEGEFDEGFQGRYSEHPFLAFAQTHGNVLITPHVGGSTIDAWRETELKTIEMARRAVES